MDPQLAMVLGLVGAFASVGGLYLRTSAREAEVARWRGRIDGKVESMPDSLKELEHKMSEQHRDLRDEISRQSEKLHSRITELKGEVHKISLAMARSGINGGKHRPGGGD